MYEGMLYQLQRSILLKAPLSEIWEFFSNPHNLPKITPAWLNFRISSTNQERMYPGQIISYTVSPLFGVPMLWVSEITQVSEPFYFIDEQRHGPYRIWHHQHWFEETSQGVLVKDIVDYMLPYGLLGRALHPFLIKRKLDSIFEYRSEVLSRHFGPSTSEP